MTTRQHSRPYAPRTIVALLLWPVFALAQVAAPTADDALRDPFWPVGYEPVPVVEDVPVADVPSVVDEPVVPQAARWPALNVKGITKTAKGYVAIIEDVGVIEAGQVVTMRQGNVIFSWRINKITKTRLDFTQLEARAARGPASE